MHKTIELARHMMGWDFFYTTTDERPRYVLCGEGLARYFALPRPFPRRMWLRLSTTKTRDSYPVKVVKYNYLLIKLETGAETRCVYNAVTDEIRKFPNRECYLSIIYEEED